jgi:hypothetical protein
VGAIPVLRSIATQTPVWLTKAEASAYKEDDLVLLAVKFTVPDRDGKMYDYIVAMDKEGAEELTIIDYVAKHILDDNRLNMKFHKKKNHQHHYQISL